jgi:RNA polymerase sigma-70 factor (ECF subfamily)
LVLAIQRGEHRALAAAYDSHAVAMYRLAIGVLLRGDAAEEIVQDVFLRLWEQPGRFDPERGSLRTFLLVSTRAKSIERWRADSARSRREARVSKPMEDDANGPEGAACEQATRVRVKQALSTLGDIERLAIVLAFFGEQTYRQVAVALDTSEGTVKRRIRSGLSKVRADLGSEYRDVN